MTTSRDPCLPRGIAPHLAMVAILRAGAPPPAPVHGNGRMSVRPGRRGMTAGAWIIPALLFGMPGPAACHEVVLEATRGDAVLLDLRHHDGSPFSHESYEIRPEGGEVAFQSGRTDANGRIAFAPGRASTWRLVARSEDGHGIDTSFETTGPGSVEIAPRSPFDRFPRIVAGVGVILGIFGLWQLLAGRTRGEGRRRP